MSKIKSNSPKLAIFDTFKTKSRQLTGEALRQRSIIISLAMGDNPMDKTRTSISKKIASQSGVVWKNLYSGVFRDLDEILIPLGLVEEEGRLPLKRGPKALQEKGVPYYKLTQSGLLVSLSINEIKNRKEILEGFFSNSSKDENEFYDIILKLTEIAPKFTFSLFEKYVKAYCEGKLKLVPFKFQNLKDTSDEGLIIQKEFLECFTNLSKSEREKTVNLLNQVC
ncbi:MAG: hypothetical protein NPMRTH1_120011 [Nitrosopumilales archaeon]|nr:MAG: hypothetical protein NPMRTH1_120011 [Nitrosopumilales archaeon]